MLSDIMPNKWKWVKVVIAVSDIYFFIVVWEINLYIYLF